MVRSLLSNLFLFVLLGACASDPVGLATGNLEVDHMPPPEADSVVNQLDTIAILPLTADMMVDETLTDLTLTGQADIGSGWSASDFDAVVVNCGLFDGATQFGSFTAPDPATGRMAYAAISIPVTAGTVRMVSVNCEMDSAVEQPSGDRITVGIASDADVAATSMMGAAPVIVGESALREAGSVPGEDPMAATTVLPFGTFAVSRGNDSPAGAVLAGGEDVLARYPLDVGAEGALIDTLSIPVGGDGGSYTSVIIRFNGMEVDRRSVPAGTGNVIDLDLSASPLLAPRDTLSTIELAAVLATPPVFGEEVSLGLNLHATGEDSGAELHSIAAPPLEGGTLVLRNASLAVSSAGLSMAYTPDANLVLYEWSMSCPEGQASVMRMFVLADETFASGPNYAIFSGLSLLADGVPVEGVEFRDVMGQDINTTGGVGTFDRVDIRINVIFTQEMLIGATSVNYQLMGRIAGVDTGETIRVRLGPDGGSGDTGFLTPSNALDSAGTFSERARGPFVDLGTVADPLIPSWGTAEERLLIGSFLWSDFQSASHSDAAGADSGSRDWIDGLGTALAAERLITN